MKKSHRKLHSFRPGHGHKRAVGCPADRTGDYDPCWLEAAAAYHRYSERFCDDPQEPLIIQLPLNPDFLLPLDADDVRETLQRIPRGFLRGLQAVFLLSGTRKQERSAWGDSFSYGCYWSDCVFLHPFPRCMLRSVYSRPPRPSDLHDYRRTGAVVFTGSDGTTVQFDTESLRRLYLCDVLVHEIGHHVDRTNLGNSREEEAFANWFATEFGFRRRGRRERRID